MSGTLRGNRMRTLLVALLLAMVALAGCTDDVDPETNDADGDGFTDAEEEQAGTDPDDENSKPEPAPEEDPEPEIQTEFTFGPGAGCDGNSGLLGGPVTCASFNAGPETAPTEVADGYWIPLGEGYERVKFTSTVENQLGDSDCFYTNEALEITGDAFNSDGPCEGTVPTGTAYLFIFSYVEPHQGITVTFTP